MSARRTDSAWAHLLRNACTAGRMAAAEAQVTPMTVVGGGERFHVPEGPCGFGWVTVAGNTAFAAWLRRSGEMLDEQERRPLNATERARAEREGGRWGRGYPGGLQFWVWHGGQSVARKEAYAYAMARHLTEGGVPATAGSRMD